MKILAIMIMFSLVFSQDSSIIQAQQKAEKKQKIETLLDEMEEHLEKINSNMEFGEKYTKDISILIQANAGIKDIGIKIYFRNSLYEEASKSIHYIDSLIILCQKESEDVFLHEFFIAEKHKEKIFFLKEEMRKNYRRTNEDIKNGLFLN